MTPQPPDTGAVKVAAPGARRRSHLLGAALLAFGSVVYLVSRMVALSADQPPWHLVNYSSIDEFNYLMPALNLIRHGSWTFQSASYAPLYGWPMNVLDNVVAWMTLSIWGKTYYGLRMGSVLMGLAAFLAVIAAVRAIANEARDEGALGRRGPLLLMSAAMAFLLVEFSTLVVSRVAEPTMGRMLALAVLLWLTARKTFFPDDRSRLLPTLFLGAYAGAAVWFVYVYNAFIIPAVILAVIAWAWRDGLRGLIRHGAALAAGVCVSTCLYFGFVWLMYHVGPSGWYRLWIGAYSGTGRAAGISWGSLWFILQSTLFRLNRPLLLLFLLSLGGFAWWAVKSRRPIAVLTVATLVMFELQSLFLSDYWGRKFVVVAPLVIIVIAAAVAWFRPLSAWVLARRRNMIAAIACGIVTAYLYLAATGVLRAPVCFYLTPHSSVAWGTRSLVLLAAGLVLALLWQARASLRSRWWVGAVAAGLVLAAIAMPALWADRRYVYGHPTYKYRDMMITIGTYVDGRVTAGYWSWGMQLYNTSDPQLPGAYYGITKSQYAAAMVRFFDEGRASYLFDYSAPRESAKLAALGFKLLESYDMNLPRGIKMGRYVYAGRAGGSSGTNATPSIGLGK